MKILVLKTINYESKVELALLNLVELKVIYFDHFVKINGIRIIENNQ